MCLDPARAMGVRRLGRRALSHQYSHLVLGRSVRFVGPLAFVELRRGVEAKLCRKDLEAVARRYPTWRLRLDPNGKRRAYVRLVKGSERHQLSRVLLSMWGEGDQSRRQARYRNGSPLDLTPENVLLPGRGPVPGSDQTHQETARRGWIVMGGGMVDGGSKC